MRIKIPEPISGGLILSYQCSAECAHCMYACSPAWPADWISEEDLEKVLSGLAGKITPAPFGPGRIDFNYGLHFTGGEPFLRFELLLKGVGIADQLSIPSLFVETNCFWCVDDRKTREKLRLLKAKGLRGIMISVNPFFLEYVPFERTERAIRISREVFGGNTLVYQREYFRRFREWGIRGRVSFGDYLKRENKEEFFWNIEFFISGRAPYALKNVLGEVFPRYPPASLFKLPCRPPFLRNWHNHFDNYGNFIPGYCGGISLGDCRKLDRLLKEGIRREEYTVLAFIVNDDFGGLFRFAQGLGYREDFEGYFSKCHFCVDIRRFLVTKKEFKELKPVEFYQHLG